MERTISLIIQAACFIEMEAEFLSEMRVVDHRGREPEQLKNIAATNRAFARALRAHASDLEKSLAA